MKNVTAFTIAGIGIGVFVGSSMGVAAFGGAVNAAWVFGPVGGFIGLLVSGRLSTSNTDTKSSQYDETTLASAEIEFLENKRDHVSSVIRSGLMLLAYVWNAHIAVIDRLGLLDTFTRAPVLFFGLCIVITVFFPPFLVPYFLCWLAASHFDATEASRFYAKVP
jgi:uncharacterized membrane protein (DUF485 family)